jgi:hypothetical protein
MPQSCDMGQMALLPLRRKARWGFFFARKIRLLRQGLSPRTWVPEASMLTSRPPKPLTLFIIGQGISPEDFLLCDSWHSFVSLADPIHYNSGYWSSLETHYLVSQWTHQCLLQSLYIVDNDVFCRPCMLWHSRQCLLQTLHIEAQWTMESPTDPPLSVTVDTSVSPTKPIYCGIVEKDVSYRAYTMWHSGQWCLLQSLYIVA